MRWSFSNLALRLLMATGLLAFVGVSAEIFYVTPAPSTPCPQEGEPCFTLSQYAIKPDGYFPTNTTVVISLLPGNHNLDSPFWISNVTSLTIFSVSRSDTTITCSESAMFSFERIGIVILSRLLFIGCENSRVTSVSHFTLGHCSLQGLQGHNGSGLEISDVITANITRSSFSSFSTDRELAIPRFSDVLRGGGALIVKYGESVTISNSTFNSDTVTGDNGLGGAVAALFSNISINGSTFVSNAVNGENGLGGAVAALFSNITVNCSMFINNAVTGRNGIGGFGGAVYTFYSTLTLYSSTFTNNTVVENYGAGGALDAVNTTVGINFCTFNNNIMIADNGFGGAVSALDGALLTVDNSVFTNNTVSGRNGTGGAFFAHNCTICIHSSTFISNKAVMGDNVIQHEAVAHTLSPGYRFDTILNSSVGGALFVAYSTVAINFSTFTNNVVIGYLGDGGAVVTMDSATTIDNCMFTNNTVTGISATSGAIHSLTVDSEVCSWIAVNNCTFNNNVVVAEGRPLFSSTSIQESLAIQYAYTAVGGAVFTYSSVLNRICNCTFTDNSVTGRHAFGGAVASYYGNETTIDQSTFTSNTVTGKYQGAGGAVHVINGTLSVSRSMFSKNSVTGYDIGWGGAMFIGGCVTALNTTSFTSNTVTMSGDAAGQGGAVCYGDVPVSHNKPLNISSYNCTFIDNSVTGEGGALYLAIANFHSSGFLTIQHNTAHRGALYAFYGTVYISGTITVSNNRGSLFASFCEVTLMGYTNIINNSILSNTSQEGGAVTAFRSEITFVGTTSLMSNMAIQGGAVSATESKVYLHGNTVIAYNKASVSGGGIYAYQSELTFEGNVSISRNTAARRGGGIHAISSTVQLLDGSKTFFTSNHAERGGGVCLEFNAKLYIIKSTTECARYNLTSFVDNRLIYCEDNPESLLRVDFTENSADYGGALYVTDETNSGVCYTIPFTDESTVSSECFLQALGVFHHVKLTTWKYTNTLSTHFANNSASSRVRVAVKLTIWNYLNTLNSHFTNNSARVAGGILYGGLLDRCTVSPVAELFVKYANLTPTSLDGASYILNVTDIQLEDLSSPKMVSSSAVRICFCNKNSQPDCSYYPPPRFVKKGETFTVPLVAVDQVNNTIANVSVHSFLSLQANLGEKQSIQQTNLDGSCSDMVYNVFSPQDSEQLQLYASGPCAGIGISKASLVVNILPCPIGFKDANLSCECDPDLFPHYISGCSIDKDSVIRKGSVWFTFVNTTDYQGYMYHQHCPFDYCWPPCEEISVNLSTIPNGSDAMCAFDHSGKLCGSCKDILSLSLGSSRCMPCSNNWLALLFVFAVAGIALVALLLWCNLTVPYGTINGLIFMLTSLQQTLPSSFHFKSQVY